MREDWCSFQIHRGFLQRDASTRALWSDKQNCSHNVSHKFQPIRRFSESNLSFCGCVAELQCHQMTSTYQCYYNQCSHRADFWWCFGLFDGSQKSPNLRIYFAFCHCHALKLGPVCMRKLGGIHSKFQWQHKGDVFG